MLEKSIENYKNNNVFAWNRRGLSATHSNMLFVSFGSRMLKQRIPSALHFSFTPQFLRYVRKD